MNTQNSPIETMEIQGCKVMIKYAADKESAISLRSIEEMLLSSHLQTPRPHPCLNCAPIQ
ncbi:MAG: hypothetical protein IJJ99_00630 [Oscillospiraceae bacterium]|nr:hypothetical protein [Oscillospiraceae bacterium]